MNRRRAAAVAGAVTATAVAATLAIGVNFGLFGLASNADRVGTIRPIDVPGAPAASQPAPADTDATLQPPAPAPVAVVDAPGHRDRDEDRRGTTEVEADD